MPYIVELFYQIDGTGGAWTQVKKCQTPAFVGSKVKFQLVTPALPAGQHTVYVKAVAQYSASSPAVEIVSDPFSFTVSPAVPQPGAVPIAVSYDPNSLLTYSGEPYSDPNPAANLHMYYKDAAGWKEMPVAGLDTVRSVVTGMSVTFDNDFTLEYISPGCVVDE